MSVYIPGMEMPKSCYDCQFALDGMCVAMTPVSTRHWKAEETTNYCPLVPVPEHSGLFDVGQFEKGCFYGYGHDGKVYKLMWDTKVFDGAKKVYINPIVSADKEGEG